MFDDDFNDDYADWIMRFDEGAIAERGFDEDDELDQDLIDDLYDEGMDVEDAWAEYHLRV